MFKQINIWIVLLLFSVPACSDINNDVSIIFNDIDQILQNLKPGEYIKNIIPMRERVQIMERWIKWKKENVLPEVMREQNIELWVVRNNEADLYYNNEGPVYTSLLPSNLQGLALPSTYASGVSQTLPDFMMYYDTGEKIEYVEPRNYEHITELVMERDPATIAIGQHNNKEMLEALGSKYSARSIDSWLLGVRWLETMSPQQIEVFRYVMGLHNDILAEGFSNVAITPDVTTSDDLNWWFRHRMQELGIENENHPTIEIQRSPANMEKYPEEAEAFLGDQFKYNIASVVIRRGDIVNCDSDIMMLGLVTDSHQYAYVLKKNETEVPKVLNEALKKANRLQDLIAKEYKIGRTGKEIEDASHAIPSEGGVHNFSGASLSFHPPAMFIRRFMLGGLMFWKGTYVAGISSQPQYYPTSIVSDQHKLSYNTVHVFHPHISVEVPGWGANGVRLGVGQIVAFTEDGFRYLNRAQEHSLHEIR